MPDPSQAPPASVDPTVLQSLVARLGERGPALVERLLDTWRSETATRLAEVEAAAAAGDTGGLGRAAHAIRGGSASLGAVRLAAVCADVEDRVRAGEPIDLEAARRRIAGAVREARQGLSQLSEGSSG